MEEYANKFLELLRYVRYIKDKKVKIQCFLSGLPQYYKDKIEFYEPRNMEEEIRKATYFYEQSKRKPDIHKVWKENKKEKFDQRKKGFKPSHFRNQQRQSSQAVNQPTRVMTEKPRYPQHNKEPLQCWKCGGPHMRRNYPLGDGNVRPAYNIQEAETVDQVAREVPRIYVAMEERHADHQ